MKDNIKEVLFQLDEQSPDEYIVKSPAPGRYSHIPYRGSFIEPGQYTGQLQQLNTTYKLKMPPGISGVVSQALLNDQIEFVEYGQPLFRLSTEAGKFSSEHQKPAQAPGITDESDRVPEGMVGVTSPTDGVFYMRPNPQSPPYATEGEEVVEGDVLGLVEVMKCFNKIKLNDLGGSQKGKIKKIFKDDAAEVKFGELLFIIEPG